jgi:hypothetical protein
MQSAAGTSAAGREGIIRDGRGIRATLDKLSNKAASGGSNPEETLFYNSLDYDLEKHLHSLPEEFKSAILLVDVNQLSSCRGGSRGRWKCRL